MVYLVTKNQELFTNDVYTIINVQESLDLLNTIQIVSLDTETEGLDPYTKKLLLVQLGCKDFQIVIDCRTVDIKEYKEYLESDRLFLGWNLKFDLKFLYHKNIYLKKVYDGFLAEKLLWLGYPAGMHSMSLKSAGENYLNIELDKSVRGKIIWSKTLTNDIIEYSANDVKYLEDIKNAQEKSLIEKDLLKAADIENRFVLPLAYCEYCGVKLDIDRWKDKMVKDEKRVKEAEEACNKWLVENKSNDSKYVYIDYQGSLFDGYDLTPKVKLNWNSPKQLISLFKEYGVEVTIEDKDKGGIKDSIDAKVLKPQKDKCSLIPLYLEYKEAVKVTSTYGQNFLDQINPISGRIHTNYNSLGSDTGRLSSGGKDKDNHTEYINMQNLPADAETRACFVSEKANKWISIDYSGEESVIMASISNDKAMINELMYGEKDLHTLTAKLIYPQIPKDMPAKEVKQQFHHERGEAKRYEFAFNYAGNADTIMRNFGLTREVAENIYNSYMKGFNGLKVYQEKQKRLWFEQGYILINQWSKRKAFIYDYQKLLETKQWMSTLDWDYYRQMKKECPECDTVQRVKNFFKRKAATDKQSCNYEIQGTGAEIFKCASIKFFEYLRTNNLLGKVKLCIPVHDEWNIEAPKEIAEEIAQKLYECMIKAGEFFCTRCKLDADISRLEDGSLPSYWIH